MSRCEKLKREKVEAEIAAGYISRQKHPTQPLYILNYTRKCQYDWHWNKETIHCRGLITDDNWNIKYKPFPKFFTPEQYKTLRCSVYDLYDVKYKDLYTGNFTVTEKVDGSLGIAYWDGNKWAIATRGSFISEQAVRGTEILQKKYKDVEFNPEYTYLFEIIYPENRIVVDYDNYEDLVLLEVIHTESGKPDNSRRIDIFPQPAQYYFSSFNELVEYTQKLDRKGNEWEGYVAQFENDIRVKLKTENYVELSHLLKNFSNRRLCELVIEHKSAEAVNQLPEEAKDTYLDKITKLYRIYESLLNKCRELSDWNCWLSDRDFGLKFGNHQYSGIIFAIRKNKNIRDTIWNYILKNKLYEDI